MPCQECENGKYKWGETGECLYETLEDCQTANQGEYLEETLKPSSDIHVDVDFTMHFTKEQMEELHTEGEVLIEVEGNEEGEKMNILFTYDKEEEREEELEEIEEDDDEIRKEEELEDAYSNLTKSMLDDELDDYIDKITDAIKKL